MKEKPKSSCCEKCFDSFGGGTTMLPLIRRCMNLDCSCHTTSKSEEMTDRQIQAEWKEQFEPHLENWEERFLKEWNDAEGGVGLPNFLLPFISTLLQEERNKMSDKLEKIMEIESHNEMCTAIYDEICNLQQQ